MSYIVDRVGIAGDYGDSEEQLHFHLQRYLNSKHDHHKPWEVVNIISIEKLYSSAADVTAGKVTGLNVIILWRTHR